MFRYDDYYRALKQYRLKIGLTQAAIAKIVGISRNYYSEIENGKTKPSIDVLEKINGIIPLIFLKTKVDKRD